MKLRRKHRDVIYRFTPTHGLVSWQEADGSLTREAVDLLATYNAERGRGFMTELQDTFNYLDGIGIR